MRQVLMVCLLYFFLLPGFRSTTDFTVKGIVQDAKTGAALGQVIVQAKGSTKTTRTLADGSFSIVVPEGTVSLGFTAAGYASLAIRIKNDGKPLLVKLDYAGKELKEVVVTALGTKREKKIIGYADRIPTPSVHSDLPQYSLSGKVRGVSLADRAYELRRGRILNKDNDPGAIQDANDFNTESYDQIIENRFLTATANPLSTFSIDVDGASYSNVRRLLQMGQMPPEGAVRIEELINYFHYDYPQPKGEDPFSINTEIGDCSWSPTHKLVMIGLQGKKIPMENLPASNLVFLIDVSGSMMEPEKLPLVQSSMKLLVDQLREHDKVALVVYAGQAGLVMPPTSGNEKQKIKNAIDRLEAGGSTAGGAGIKLAYQTALENFKTGGNNRVILCTDGDFNVGASSDSELEKLIEKESKTGIYLTVLGYGMGNYKDSKMEKLADKGNGNHAYIDNFNEARKVLVNEFGGTLFTIAKDVKLQVEFNPARVQAYRLIGYENRMLNKEDFNNDKKDAGDMGSGHTVTALYEIIPVGVKNDFEEKADGLKYQEQNKPVTASFGDEMMTIKFRYKKPDGDVSKLLVHPVKDGHNGIRETSSNFRFVSAVAQFGMLLRDSEFKQEASYDKARLLARNSLGNDEGGYRAEFLKLLSDAEDLAVKTEKSIIHQEDTGKR
ncbi:MAG: von Willebrand factor type A domain-containing protein [Bacteroidota bacterium]|nr:von Willebrand factor type A domain-containing protein [Bacteroidota bacterium]